MEIRVLRYFLESARTGSITRAAERLHVTQPTLSRQLKELVADGFLERIDHKEVPPSTEYRLTRRGESFKPLLQAMWDWSEAEFEFSQAETAQMREARDTLGIAQVR